MHHGHLFRVMLMYSPVSAIPASALDEEEEDEEDDDIGEARDDERSGTRYNVCSAIHRHLIASIDILLAVFVVPCHIRHRRHVCSDAPDGLVSSPSQIPLVPYLTLSRSRNVVSKAVNPSDQDEVVFIGRSETAMWMRVVSSWVCILLYSWSLLAPVLLPDR